MKKAFEGDEVKVHAFSTLVQVEGDIKCLGKYQNRNQDEENEQFRPLHSGLS